MPLLIALMGPTASGKTATAERLAAAVGAQLISADAFQVYRGLDVGTAKPRRRHLYELIDLVEPNEPFGVGEWVKLAAAQLEATFAADRHAIVVGGTGLYVRSLFEEYADMAGPPAPELRRELNDTPIEVLRERLLQQEPTVAQKVDMANPVRVRRALERLSAAKAEPIRLPPFHKLKLALDVDERDLESRIRFRTSEMVQNGWTQEIEGLRRQGYHRDDPAFRAIGYRAMWDHTAGQLSLEEAIATTIADTRRYAKRQRTWLRTEPNLTWISATTEDGALHAAMECIESVLM